MPDSCVVCKKSTRVVSTIQCRDCKRGCHLPCVNLTKGEVDVLARENLLWRCPPCSDARLKSVRLLFAMEFCNITLDQMFLMLCEAKVAADKTGVNLTKEFFNLASKQLEDPKIASHTNLEVYVRKIDQIKEAHDKLGKSIDDIRKKIPVLEKYREEIKLADAGKKGKENIKPQTKKSRVGFFAGAGGSGSGSGSGGSAGIGGGRGNVGETECETFTEEENESTSSDMFGARTFRREECIRREVQRRSRSSRRPMPDETMVCASENMSPQKKLLLSMAELAKVARGYQFLWTSGDMIFMRKDAESKMKIIEGVEDLASL